MNAELFSISVAYRPFQCIINVCLKPLNIREWHGCCTAHLNLFVPLLSEYQDVIPNIPTLCSLLNIISSIFSHCLIRTHRKYILILIAKHNIYLLPLYLKAIKSKTSLTRHKVWIFQGFLSSVIYQTKTRINMHSIALYTSSFPVPTFN